MSDDFYFFHNKDRHTVTAFLKSKVDVVYYDLNIGDGCWGCYVGINGIRVFIPNMDIDTFFMDVLKKPSHFQEETVGKQ
jgi:hypothetical protein